MKIKTTIKSDKVRGLCIRMQYCTKATCEQYERMLEHADCELNENNLIRISNRIAGYTDCETFMDRYGCSLDEFVKSIAFNIANDCVITLIE